MISLFSKLLDFTLSGFWEFIGGALLWNGLFYFTINGAIQIFGRLFRMVMVLLKGWPPAHLDADGDFRTLPK